jgi:MoaA/NifB/PqqE/SkfB family radical SAM enzyme
MRQGDLPYETFERFLADNPELRHVELQGEGEPLMHARFFDMVSACRARNIRVSIITNGSLLGEEQVARLIEAPVESIHVSLESSDPEEFRAIRGGKFAKVVSGLRLLMERRNALGKKRPTVGFSVTVLRRTLGAMDGIVALYRELGLDGGISLQPLQDMECYTKNYTASMLADLVPQDLWSTYAPDAYEKVGQLPVRIGAASFYGALFGNFDPQGGACPWLERGAYLNIDGAESGCCFMKSASSAFGTVSVDSPESIAARRKALSDALRDGVIPEPCRGCDVATTVTGNRARRKLSLLTGEDG